MKRSPDVELVLREYFADDGLKAPDYVLDVVEGRIGRQPQRRRWPFKGRTNVTTQIKLIAGLAAALVVAAVGYSLLPGTTGPGHPSTAPAGTPSAVVSSPPSAAPSAGASCPEWKTDGCGDGAGTLTAGSHATRGFVPAFTFTVPEGWVNSSDSRDYFELFPDTPTNQAEFARSGALAQSIVMGPHNSPYFVCDAWEDNSGATAAEIVDAIVANEALATTGVADVEIGGLTGKQVDVRLNPDWTESCPGDPPGSDLGDLRTRGILLDSADRGVLVIFVGWNRVADFEFRDQIFIVESFEFDREQ